MIMGRDFVERGVKHWLRHPNLTIAPSMATKTRLCLIDGLSRVIDQDVNRITEGDVRLRHRRSPLVRSLNCRVVRKVVGHAATVAQEPR